MEKLSNISKKVDIFLKVAYWVLVTASVIVVLGFGVVLIATEVTGEPLAGQVTLEIGNLKLDLAEDYGPSVESMRAEITASLGMFVVLTIFTCYGIRLLRNILQPMTQQQPFVGTVSRDLKKLGWIMIIGSVALEIVENIGLRIIYAAYDIPNLLLSERITGVTVNYVLDVKNILVGVLLFLLSLVFHYGEELQRQADETL